MPDIKDISKAALEMISSLSDHEKRPVHVGEAMSCWMYQTQLDGVLGYCEVAINQTEDEEVINVINKSHSLGLAHKKMLDEFMNSEHISPSDGYNQKSHIDVKMVPNGIKQTEKDIVNTIQITTTTSFSIVANALSQCLRKDLQIIFFKIMTDIMLFSQEMVDLSEKRGWLRIPPAYNSK